MSHTNQSSSSHRCQLQYLVIFYIAEFNMTAVDVDSKMVALFDENSSTCENIQDIVRSQSTVQLRKLNVMGTATFDVMVRGLALCSNYNFLYVLVKNEPCDFVRSCNVTHDLATSHNICVVNCPCEDNCDILADFFSSSNQMSGTVCEIKLL